MSLVQAAPHDGTPSNLMSNNPFRNRLASGPAIPTTSPTESNRPTNTNPFLDSTEIPRHTQELPTNTTGNMAMVAKPPALSQATQLFDNLNVNERPQSRSAANPSLNGATRRPENIPPRGFARILPPNHRPSGSDQERKREFGKTGTQQVTELDIFADPKEEKNRNRGLRRNSESSVRDRPNGLLDPESERRRQERKLREAKSSGKSKKPSRKLDIIDRLDVTSIYGTGLFHHDGPFDACNPARNRRGAKHAPMHAFPADSSNMVMGGAGPLNSRLDLNRIHGTGQEAHNDYNEAAAVDEDANAVYSRRPHTSRGMSYDPAARDAVHGIPTAGLGSTTFLEGAPASRAAIQRHESVNESSLQANGLGRKKSLAQRIRAARPNIRDGRVTSPEPLGTPTTPLGTGKDESGADPFFKDYDKEYEKKGAQIAFAEEQVKPSRQRAPSSPKRGFTLERKMTNESTGEGGESKGLASGFLTRVKSLKGGRTKPRPERRETGS